MVAGTVTVQIVNADTTAIDTAVTTLRVTANDKWLCTAIGPENQQVVLIHIEEA
jgi:hypothetical protein